jgi:electron transfer flavoprotein beta subunit
MAIAPWGPADIEAAPERLGLQGSPTQVVRVFSPDRRQGEVLLMSGDTSEAQANALVAQLAQNGLV